MVAPKSRHVIFRKFSADCRKTIFDLAFPETMEATFPGIMSDRRTIINNTEMTVELENGAIFFFAGFDSNNVTRIMGDKFSTIWLNECNQFTYSDLTKMKTRLRDIKYRHDGSQLPLRMFFDLNPGSQDCWTYKTFIEKLNPAKNVPLSDPADWAAHQMNLRPEDTHLGADYLSDLMDGSDEEIAQFVHGYWRKEREHSLFRPSVVNQHRVQSAPSDLRRIVVAIDPAASSHEGSDENGIIVAAQGADDHFYVLGDYSLRGSPDEWAAAAVEAFQDHDADIVIAEKNNGGEMVGETLRHAARNLPIKLVHASRGKVLRAEPISTLYADGRVHHVGEFKELERQMFAFHSSFDRRKDGSPDRLDAMVWAITELAEAPAPSRGGSSAKLGGYW